MLQSHILGSVSTLTSTYSLILTICQIPATRNTIIPTL